MINLYYILRFLSKKRLGRLFFVVLLPLEPIAYPRPNEVKQRLSTAIKVSTVSISEVLLPSDFSNESISM